MGKSCWLASLAVQQLFPIQILLIFLSFELPPNFDKFIDCDVRWGKIYGEQYSEPCVHIYTGKRTGWSPIRYCTSDYKIAGVQFVNHEQHYRPTSDDTKSPYQLIINVPSILLVIQACTVITINLVMVNISTSYVTETSEIVLNP